MPPVHRPDQLLSAKSGMFKCHPNGTCVVKRFFWIVWYTNIHHIHPCSTPSDILSSVMPILASSTACNSGTSFTAASTLSWSLGLDTHNGSMVQKAVQFSSFSLSAFCSVSMVAARKEVALPAGAQRFRSLWSLHCETYFGEQVCTCTRDRRSYSQDAQGSSQFQKRGTIRNRLKTWNHSTDCHGDIDIPRPPRSDTIHPL